MFHAKINATTVVTQRSFNETAAQNFSRRSIFTNTIKKQVVIIFSIAAMAPQ